MGNRRLARAIGDAGWTQLARQLTYKAAWFGAELVGLRPLVPLHQDLLALRPAQGEVAVGRAGSFAATAVAW